MRLYQRPYHLFLWTAILFFLFGLCCHDSVIDIHLHDTYYVFHFTYFIWTLSIFLLVFWILYLATKSILISKKLSWTHLILTIIGCIFILIIPYFLTNSYEGLAGMSRRYHDIGQSEAYFDFDDTTRTAVITIIVLAIGQLAFVLNFVIGLFKRPDRQNNR